MSLMFMFSDYFILLNMIFIISSCVLSWNLFTGLVTMKANEWLKRWPRPMLSNLEWMSGLLASSTHTDHGCTSMMAEWCQILSCNPFKMSLWRFVCASLVFWSLVNTWTLSDLWRWYSNQVLSVRFWSGQGHDPTHGVELHCTSEPWQPWWAHDQRCVPIDVKCLKITCKHQLLFQNSPRKFAIKSVGLPRSWTNQPRLMIPKGGGPTSAWPRRCWTGNPGSPWTRAWRRPLPTLGINFENRLTWPVTDRMILTSIAYPCTKSVRSCHKVKQHLEELCIFTPTWPLLIMSNLAKKTTPSSIITDKSGRD